MKIKQTHTFQQPVNQRRNHKDHRKYSEMAINTIKKEISEIKNQTSQLKELEKEEIYPKITEVSK